MLWKLLFANLTGLALILTALLDYLWWDKRRVQFKKGRKALLAVLSVVWVGGTVLAVLEARERDAETTRLAQQLDALRSGQSKADRDAEARDQSQRTEIKKLQDMLAPFLTAARGQAPGADDVRALEALAERLRTLEQTSKDRDLPAETRAKIVQLLAPHPGTHINLQVMAADTESRRFLALVQQCFVDAGWSVDGPVLVFDKVFPRGLHLVVSKDSGSPPQLALEAALKATGQVVGGALNKSVALGSFRVVVGPK